jgi:hypothetical protein
MKNKTYVRQTQPWGVYLPYGHCVLCSDGKVRACRMAPTADTFFSIPASIAIRSKRISGYVTIEEYKNQRIYCFRHHTEHNDRLPKWPERTEKEFDTLISKGIGE